MAFQRYSAEEIPWSPWNLSAPANRVPIQQELMAARRHDERFWTKLRSYKDSGVPFPFITSCLLLGASFDVKGYNASAILEPFNMAFNGGTMTASLLLLLLI